MTIKGFIEVRGQNHNVKTLCNIVNIESVSELNDGCVVHFNNGLHNHLTVKESYEDVKEMLRSQLGYV